MTPQQREQAVKRLMSLPAQFAAEDAAKVSDPTMQQWRPEFVHTPSPQAQPQQAPQSGDINAQLMAKYSQPKGSTQQAPVSAAPKKNFLQQLVDPVADLAATGYRSIQGLGRGVQAIGQTVLGDKEGATETMRKADEDIYKPVNIPFIGQGDVRKLGTVNEKGIIMPSDETAKSLGTALELASFATPVKGSKGLTAAVGNKVFQKTASPAFAKAAGTVAKYTLPGALAGGMSSGGAKLAETGDFGEAAKSGAVGSLIGGALGTVIPKVASALSKRTTPSIVKAAEMNRKAIALSKTELKKEMISKAAAKKYGINERNMPLELAKEGLVFKTKEEAGRKVFDVADSISALATKMDAVDSQLDNLIASRPGKTFNLGGIRKQAFKFIDDRNDLSALTKSKLKESIDKEIAATVQSSGSWQTDGVTAQQLKKTFQKQAKALYEAKAKGAVVSDADMAPEALARAFREAVENQYRSYGDVSKLNKELGRLAEISKFVQGYEGGIVKGGYLGRKIGGGIGVLASQAIPAPPVIREMVGYKAGERISDFIDDPTRKMAAAVRQYQLAKSQGKVDANAIQKILDSLPEINAPAAAGILMGNSPEQQGAQQNQAEANVPQDDINARMLQKYSQRKTAQ